MTTFPYFISFTLPKDDVEIKTVYEMSMLSFKYNKTFVYIIKSDRNYSCLISSGDEEYSLVITTEKFKELLEDLERKPITEVISNLLAKARLVRGDYDE